MNERKYDQFADRVKAKMDQASVSPPDDSWDNIAWQLDLADVWQGVNQRLNQADRFRFWNRAKPFIAAAAAVLLLLLIPWPLNKQTQRQYFRHQFAVKQDSTGNTQKHLQFQGQDKDKPDAGLAEQDRRHKGLHVMQEDQDEIEKLVSQGATSGDDFYLVETPLLRDVEPVQLMGKTQGNDTMEAVDTRRTDRLAALERQQPQVLAHAAEQSRPEWGKNLSFGFNGTLSNTWLLNNKTLAGLEPRKLVNTEMNYEHSFSLISSYRFTPGFEIQAEFAYRQDKGQTYFEYINGDYVKREIDLSYVHGAAIGRFSRPAKPFLGMKAKTVLEGGLYYSYLRSAKEELQNTTTNLRNHYRNADFGLMLGVAEQLQLNDYLGVSVGVRANYGMWNVFEGSGQIPGYLNATNIASFDVILGFQVNPFH